MGNLTSIDWHLIADFLANIVDSVAWPVAVVWLGYLFRAEIRSLMGRVSQLKYKELEASFDQQLDNVEAEASEILPPRQAPDHDDEVPTYPDPYDEMYQRLLRIGEESPRTSMLEAWIEVEASLAETAEQMGYKFSPRQRPARVIRQMISEQRLAKGVLGLFEDLRGLRNEAVHAPQFEPSQKQVRRYVEMAIELALTIKHPFDPENIE